MVVATVATGGAGGKAIATALAFAKKEAAKLAANAVAQTSSKVFLKNFSRHLLTNGGANTFRVGLLGAGVGAADNAVGVYLSGGSLAQVAQAAAMGGTIGFLSPKMAFAGLGGSLAGGALGYGSGAGFTNGYVLGGAVAGIGTGAYGAYGSTQQFGQTAARRYAGMYLGMHAGSTLAGAAIGGVTTGTWEGALQGTIYGNAVGGIMGGAYIKKTVDRLNVPWNGPAGSRSAPTSGLPEHGPELAPRSVVQNSADLATLYRQAGVANAELRTLSSQIADGFGGTVINVPLKTQQRALAKITADYGGDASRILDLSRGAIVFDDVASINRALARIESTVDVVRVKNRFLNPTAEGYRDVLINIRGANGHISELQLWHRGIMDVRNGQGIRYTKRFSQSNKAIRTRH